ncbi:branched-chain alpha-keto acid dehydrogenase subunit E2 (plasmid) [Phaeobacter inhibens]|uniref:2-oxo acid dehydrogenase subunit E2 n=1 Tax=Phaeobacter TaxID=302485 RepID=UPI000971AC69|nr:2-oxo acid dehydrogenase subunit E2 [Phaeobacter inhibens]APX18008.1 branched-chain alpha-keto acid dehydrogenase subunit E2 [Phaeobacter inhibens]
MTTKIEIHVPDIGDFSDVPIVEIPISVGDTLVDGDTMIVLESDKATLDVPAEQPGVVTEIKVSEGDVVSEGTLVLMLEVSEGTGAPEAPAKETAPQTTAPLAAAPAKPTPNQPTPVPPKATAAGQPVYASPSIRAFARKLGVTIAEVKGSGPKGRITREDIETHVKGKLSEPAGQSGGISGLPDWPQVDFAKFGPVERQPLSRIARISGPALQRNAITIPHVTNFDETDVTDLEAFRKTINGEAREGEAKLTILAFTVKAVVAALKAYPKFNSSLDGDELVVKNYWHIGVAADTPDGLVVPVVKDADQKGLREIAAEMGDFAGKARAGKLKPGDMQGATFTISSLGGIGGTNFTPIINAPEVAILGMTRAGTKPVWNGTAFQPRLIQPVSLSWDHRVIDGVAAAHFLKHVTATLNDFRRITV